MTAAGPRRPAPPGAKPATVAADRSIWCPYALVSGGFATNEVDTVTQRDAVMGAVRDVSSVPEQRVGNDSAAVREVLGEAIGCTPFTLRVLRCVRGRSMQRETGGADELLFVLEGQGTLLADDGVTSSSRRAALRSWPGRATSSRTSARTISCWSALRFTTARRGCGDRCDDAVAAGRRAGAIGDGCTDVPDRL